MSCVKANLMKSNEEKLKAAVLLAAQRDGQELIDADNTEPCEPASPEARARLFAAIENNKKKPSKERHWYSPTAKKVAIAIASVIILLVMIPSTTEAGRKWITELVGKVFPSFTEFFLSDSEKVPNHEVKRYTLGYVPNGFQLIFEEYSTAGNTSMYRNEDDLVIHFEVFASSGVIQIDTENADRIETVYIQDEEGTLIVRDGITTIIWSADELCFLVDGNIEETELVKIANSVEKE